jgi:hypothetical protein
MREFEENVDKIINIYRILKLRKGEFINMIEEYRNALEDHPKDLSINHIIFNIKYKVKEFFPINEVPQNVVDALSNLEYKFEEAQFCLNHTLDTIIQEIVKIDGL